jgi:hypothetical protein
VVIRPNALLRRRSIAAPRSSSWEGGVEGARGLQFAINGFNAILDPQLRQSLSSCMSIFRQALRELLRSITANEPSGAPGHISRREAETRGNQLLMDNLSPEQRAQYVQTA